MMPVDLREVVHGATSWANRAAESKGIRLLVKAEGEPVFVSGDRDALTSLVDNLLSNAIRYTPDVGTVTIACGSTADDGWIEVRDSGIGMTAEERESIFSKFYRGSRAREMASGGLGMGLHIVRHVASIHGGSVEVESEPEAGSTFRFTVPLLQEGS